MTSLLDHIPVETIENLPGIRCPISGRIMNDPVVVAGTGVSYERDVVAFYLDMYGSDPATGLPLSEGGRRLIQNTMLRNLIDDVVRSIRRRKGDAYNWDHVVDDDDEE